MRQCNAASARRSKPNTAGEAPSSNECTDGNAKEILLWRLSKNHKIPSRPSIEKLSSCKRSARKRAEHFEVDEPNSIVWESTVGEQGCPSSISFPPLPFHFFFSLLLLFSFLSNIPTCGEFYHVCRSAPCFTIMHCLSFGSNMASRRVFPNGLTGPVQWLEENVWFHAKFLSLNKMNTNENFLFLENSCKPVCRGPTP